MGNIGLSLIIELVITALFCTTLYNTLMQVSPGNRKLQPWSIWILFFPYISIIWNFYVVWNMSGSLKQELEERNFDISSRPTFLPGIIYSAITLIMTVTVFIIPFMDMAKEMMQNRQEHPEASLNNNELALVGLGLLGLVRIICFIQYWSKTNWYRKVLVNDQTEG